MKKNVLIVSPHADDEILSSWSYLQLSKNEEINLAIIFQAVNEDDRIEVIDKIAKDMNFLYHIAFPGWDSKMDKLNISDIVSYYDDKINRMEWDEIIIPSQSFHQDHRICNNCCVAALRRNKNSSIYISEHPFHISYFTTDFTPNKYISFSNMKEKKKYLEMYKPYIKDDDIENMEQLNKFRGQQINKEYAESFQIIREVS